MIRISRINLALIAVAAAVIGLALGLQLGSADSTLPVSETHNFPTVECVTEDSTNCFWDATTHGNGAGHSFYDVNGEVTYVD